MKISIVLLATALTVVGMPLAAADAESEKNPDCEAGQPGLGYTTTAVVWETLGDAPVFACEGEHWDGQDPIHDQEASCSATVSPNPILVGLCLGSDVNAMAGDDPTTPLGVRVTSDGSSQVYVAGNIALVGRAVLYVSDDTVGVYLRDNTPGNVLATAISAARVTKGFVSEADCTQETYQEGAISGDSDCGRDNTAVTLVLA